MIPETAVTEAQMYLGGRWGGAQDRTPYWRKEIIRRSIEKLRAGRAQDEYGISDNLYAAYIVGWIDGATLGEDLPRERLP